MTTVMMGRGCEAAHWAGGEYPASCGVIVAALDFKIAGV